METSLRASHRPGRGQLQNCTTNGDNAQRPVGADDPVRPLGVHGFAAAYHKKRSCLPHGESAASPPTNGVRVCRGASMFAGACRRADRGVRPYGCAPLRIGAFNFAALCRAGGASPAPTLRRNARQPGNNDPSPHQPAPRTVPPRREALEKRKPPHLGRLFAHFFAQ